MTKFRICAIHLWIIFHLSLCEVYSLIYKQRMIGTIQYIKRRKMVHGYIVIKKFKVNYDLKTIMRKVQFIHPPLNLKTRWVCKINCRTHKNASENKFYENSFLWIHIKL